MTDSDDCSDSDSMGHRMETESSDDDYIKELMDLTIDKEVTVEIKFDPNDKPPIRKFDKFFCDQKHLMELRTTGQTAAESRRGNKIIKWWCNICKT